jgi:hypothetical protein
MTRTRQLLRPALLLAACWLSALPAWAAPVSFRSGDGEIAMEELPYREAQACKSVQCQAMRYAILGTQRPHTVLSLTVRRHGRVYKLPTDGMVDPQLGWKTSSRLALACDEADNCTVRGVFGDGGATYAAEWIIQNGRATRTVFSTSMDLNGFIGEHLQAPTYR